MKPLQKLENIIRKSFFTKIVILFLLGVLLAIGVSLSRHWLWRQAPSFRFLSVHAIGYKSLQGCSVKKVYELLGPPDMVKHYTRVRIVGENNEVKYLMFQLDATNTITSISSTANEGQAGYSMDAWQASDDAYRVKMIPDLIKRWNNGELKGLLNEHRDISNMFPQSEYVYYLKYTLSMPRVTGLLAMDSLEVTINTNSIIVRSKIIPE